MPAVARRHAAGRSDRRAASGDRQLPLAGLGSGRPFTGLPLPPRRRPPCGPVSASPGRRLSPAGAAGHLLHASAVSRCCPAKAGNRAGEFVVAFEVEPAESGDGRDGPNAGEGGGGIGPASSLPSRSSRRRRLRRPQRRRRREGNRTGEFVASKVEPAEAAETAPTPAATGPVNRLQVARAAEHATTANAVARGRPRLSEGPGARRGRVRTAGVRLPPGIGESARPGGEAARDRPR